METKIVKHLGRVSSQTDMERYRKMFALEKQNDYIARADLRQFDVMPPESTAIYASQVLCHDLGLDGVFSMLGGTLRDHLHLCGLQDYVSFI